MNNLICLRWLDLCRNKLSTEDLKIIFHLYLLQTLKLWDCCLEEIPNGIENLSDFRILDLAENELKEVPTEIGNLEQLRHLDLAGNKFSKQLPSEIGKLNLLQTLRLPIWEIHCQIPKALAQLTGLRELTGFKGGSGWSKLGLLKNLNKLGVLRLLIKLDDKDLKDMVEDAQGAELSKKMHIEQLELIFEDEMGREESLSSSRERMDIIEVLAPHSNLRILYISGYNGPKLPLWIVSPVNKLRRVYLKSCHLTSLPSFGKLPCLEEIYIDENNVLEFIGLEFLGITANTNFVAFPKLKTLIVEHCDKWKEWEDCYRYLNE